MPWQSFGDRTTAWLPNAEQERCDCSVTYDGRYDMNNGSKFWLYSYIKFPVRKLLGLCRSNASAWSMKSK